MNINEESEEKDNLTLMTPWELEFKGMKLQKRRIKRN
jgi:hypothetical protein